MSEELDKLFEEAENRLKAERDKAINSIKAELQKAKEEALS
jgi:hypothetical protein